MKKKKKIIVKPRKREKNEMKNMHPGWMKSSNKGQLTPKIRLVSV